MPERRHSLRSPSLVVLHSCRSTEPEPQNRAAQHYNGAAFFFSCYITILYCDFLLFSVGWTGRDLYLRATLMVVNYNHSFRSYSATQLPAPEPFLFGQARLLDTNTWMALPPRRSRQDDTSRWGNCAHSSARPLLSLIVAHAKGLR